MKRIYVAGPMSGLPDYNYPAFFAAAEALRADGWHVENPADCPLPQGSPWVDFMRFGLAQLVTCDAIYLLPGWENSHGAVLERKVALALGLEVRGHSEGRDADELYRTLCNGYTLDELRRMSLTFKAQINVLRGRVAAPSVADVARTIWNIRRDEEDRCDMELEDIPRYHSVWREAEAVRAMFAAAARGEDAA